MSTRVTCPSCGKVVITPSDGILPRRCARCGQMLQNVLAPPPSEPEALASSEPEAPLAPMTAEPPATREPAPVPGELLPVEPPPVEPVAPVRMKAEPLPVEPPPAPPEPPEPPDVPLAPMPYKAVFTEMQFEDPIPFRSGSEPAGTDAVRVVARAQPGARSSTRVARRLGRDGLGWFLYLLLVLLVLAVTAAAIWFGGQRQGLWGTATPASPEANSSPKSSVGAKNLP